MANIENEFFDGALVKNEAKRQKFDLASPWITRF